MICEENRLYQFGKEAPSLFTMLNGENQAWYVSTSMLVLSQANGTNNQ